MPHLQPDPDFDARTLAEAAAIKADPARSVAARESAAQLARVKAVEAIQLSRVVREAPQRREPGAKESAIMQSSDGRQVHVYTADRPLHHRRMGCTGCAFKMETRKKNLSRYSRYYCHGMRSNNLHSAGILEG